jgi:hypothetical protein
MIEEYRMALKDYEKKRKSLRDSNTQRWHDNRIAMLEMHKFVKEVEARYIEEVKESRSQRRTTRSMARSQDQHDFKLTPEEQDDLKLTLEEEGIHHSSLKAQNTTLTR